MPQTLTKEELLDLYEETAENIDSMEDAGVLSSNEADAHRYNLVDEFKEYLSELEGLTPEEMEEFEEVIEIEPNNDFGMFLMEYGLENGYDDFEEYIDDLADACNCEPEDILELIVGESEPDDDTIEAIANALGLEGEEEEEYYDAADYDPQEEEEEMDDSDYGYYDNPDGEYEDRIAELEDQIASFQGESLLKDTISDIDRRAQDLVSVGDLPPAAYHIIMGNFDTDGDRLAAFSQVAASNGVGLDSELHAAGKVLDVFERLGLGELGMFDGLVEDEVSEFAMNEEAAAIEQAARNREYAKKKKAGIR